jgi:multidrug efflux pump subunit AcrA (membrane-fusion protein)
MKIRFARWAAVIITAVAGGCGDDRQGPAVQPPANEPAPQPTNRIDLPATVRQNLGITFAKVERRHVASTIRVPGTFELLPSGRREYRSTLPGWVKLIANEYEQVKAGAVIGEIDSPEWHKLRRELHEGQAAIERAEAELAVAQHTKAETEQAIAVREQRIEALAGAEVRRAELEADLSTFRNSLPRLDAEIRVKQAALNEAKHDFALQVDIAAALLNLQADYLLQATDDSSAGDGHGGHHGTQRWYTIKRVSVTATNTGVVEKLYVTNGSWIDANALIATIVDPAALRFRAIGLQSDLGRLRDGLNASIVPPQGSGIDEAHSLPGSLKVGLVGDPAQRTIELLVAPEKVAPWARPGVSALLEIAVEDSAEPELAIPASAVVRDELTSIFFRRDPADPNKVIRMEADLGITDGKWVVVKSGVKEGDEIVLDGVYELKLAGGGKAMGGGHFHADGTWHADPSK